MSSRTWYQHLDDLEAIIKDASQAAKYVIDTLWDIRTFQEFKKKHTISEFGISRRQAIVVCTIWTITAIFTEVIIPFVVPPDVATGAGNIGQSLNKRRKL